MGVSMRHFCQKTWDSTVENGQPQTKRSRRSSFSVKKPANRKTSVYRVTKDQSGWGFVVKRGATTIHEDSATSTVSTSSLEASSHPRPPLEASRGDSRTTHAVTFTGAMTLPQKAKSGMGIPDWNVSMVDIHL